ncbi:MarR family transcriptional regulator [soil metagenome]
MTNRRTPRPAKTAATGGPFYRGNAYRIEDSVGHLVRLLIGSMNRRIDTRMQPHDLTALQWKPLLMLKFGLADTAAELARQNGSDTGAMTRMIDRLETKGLLQRTRSEHDRRVVHLELTADGRKAADQVPFELSGVLNEHLAGFTQKEFEQLLSMLRRMIDNGAHAAAADVDAGDADTRGTSTDHASTNRSRTGSTQ